ncbi:hypothetical protein OO007_15805 [Cocleimonas sp. KMM 6892]|uniref:hypothetical protein n=1 Tax=unclassified Cocleimonas TaxID=2639732 RepID=UPI002DBF42F6|nr:MULTISPECIES: hypothetical protein [unclassified Cocleimonas]MEB8433704.1 hypothetical protein [Cocleimonas sp. KMM 6892]MEC4716515.1 hypothetical protein [Cocleimonas sp. KMM 6895]MEC4746330.1 hypothetical protein [Cocleimonas sp. KMM 6896]
MNTRLTVKTDLITNLSTKSGNDLGINLGTNVDTRKPFNSAPKFGKALFGLVMCSVCVITHATESDENTNDSYSIKVVKKQAADKTVSYTVKPEKTDPLKSADSNDARTIRLGEGGIIWVSNDPVSLTPLLNVSTNKDVKFSGNEFESDVTFTLNTNYAAFIDSWELDIYRATDDDERRPLKSFSGSNLINGQTIAWNGDVKKGEKLTAGDELKYILTVRNKTGHSDTTNARTITLQGPGRNFDTDTVSTQSVENNLDRQTIPLYGSRIRLFGNDIFDHNQISIDGEKVTITENRFVVERLLPEGKHEFNVEITENNEASYSKKLNVDVDGRYMFMVGLADVTIGEGSVSDNLETLTDGDKYLEGDIFVDGRIAFYLKGKVKGKYLVTAQMDTGTADIEDLFDDIHKKDSQSLFRRLDPDQYYPVYGDDSTIIDDTDSQGKMYVRVDWDKSRALWGNFNTDMTGTELSSFNRSLYGAKLSHKSTQVTSDGDHKTDVTVFASEAQSAFRHNQFLGTGGSLYYLKDTDIVVGSEKVWVEVRDRNSERAIETIVMEEGRDYEIDDYQGRIILHRPLLQIAEQASPSLVKDNPLDGDQVYLMVDYEYVPDDFESDKASYGTRGKVWLNDHFAVGGTYAHENRDNDDYDLQGVDITLKKSKGTYFTAEYAESESLQTAGSFKSIDGGLNFNDLISDDGLTDKKGTAYSFEARANLEDFSKHTGVLGAWYSHRDAGFSSARLEQGTETVGAGVEAIIETMKAMKLSAKSTLLDKKDISKVTTASVQADYTLNDKVTLSAEVRHIKEEDQSENVNTSESIDGEGTLAAFRVGYDVNKDINLYVIAQSTLSKSGAYTSNDLITLGTKAKLNDKIDLNAEFSTGDRGEAVTLGADYKVSKDHTVYTNYTLSTDDSSDQGNLFTVGQRKSISNRLKVFSEHQFTHEDKQSGLGHTFGIDHEYDDDITLSASVQTARLDKEDGGITDRDAFSVGLTYEKGKSTGSSRLEYRRDKGQTNLVPEDTEQWVTTNRLNYQLSPSLRLQGKVNYSVTKDIIGNSNDAKFAEVGFGFAFRPVDNDRLNILGRLTYLYDLQPISQSTEADEKSLIASLETTYQLNQKWQVGGKMAHKLGEIRTDRDSGSWEKNDATLVAASVTYHLNKKWDAMAQYHWMNSDESQDTQHGAMISVDRHINENMKVGIGYNFTNFDDDLSNTSGDAEGWFINLVGKF